MNPFYTFGNVLRILFCLVVAYTIPTKYLWFKSMLIIWGSEFFDFYPVKWIMGSRMEDASYHVYDKITDQIINIVFLRWLSQHPEVVRFDKTWMNIFLKVLWVLLILRIIGMVLFFLTKERKWFVYFPNFVGDLIVFYCVFATFALPVWFRTILIVIFFCLKIFWEWKMHWIPVEKKIPSQS